MERPLLERVASGDEQAIEECLDRFGGLVYSIARRLSPSSADADDAVQDVFIDLWRNAGRFRADVASEKTFVAMIARRRLIDRWRREGRRPGTESLAGAAEPATPVGPDQLETADDARLAAAALQKLDPVPREVLELSVYEGLSHRAIADRLELPLGTVKTHVRRSLDKVRRSLGAPRPGSEGVSP